MVETDFTVPYTLTMINETFVVAFQDENNIPHFSAEHLASTTWTPNAMLSERFDTFQLAWDALKYIECTDKPKFGMVVMAYSSVMQYSYKWLDEILDKAAES